MRKNHSRFTSGGMFKQGGVYTCRLCGKRTRETGHEESNFELCKKCLLDTYRENAHFDGLHKGQPDPTCPYCQKGE